MDDHCNCLNWIHKRNGHWKRYWILNIIWISNAANQQLTHSITVSVISQLSRSLDSIQYKKAFNNTISSILKAFNKSRRSQNLQQCKSPCLKAIDSKMALTTWAFFVDCLIPSIEAQAVLSLIGAWNQEGEKLKYISDKTDKLTPEQVLIAEIGFEIQYIILLRIAIITTLVMSSYLPI